MQAGRGSAARANGEIGLGRTLCKKDFPNPVDERKLTYKQTRDMQTNTQTNKRALQERTPPSARTVRGSPKECT